MMSFVTSKQKAKTSPNCKNPPENIIRCTIFIRFIDSIPNPTTYQVRNEEKSMPNTRIPRIILVWIDVAKQPTGKIRNDAK